MSLTIKGLGVEMSHNKISISKTCTLCMYLNVSFMKTMTLTHYISKRRHIIQKYDSGAR